MYGDVVQNTLSLTTLVDYLNIIVSAEKRLEIMSNIRYRVRIHSGFLMYTSHKVVKKKKYKKQKQIDFLINNETFLFICLIINEQCPLNMK